MDTIKRKRLVIDNLGSKLASIIVWIISISWGLFLISNYSNIKESAYSFQGGYYNSSFLVVDKYKQVNIFNETDSHQNILSLKDRSGRSFIVSGVADSYFKTINKGETVSIGITRSSILRTYRTPFQIWSALGSVLVAVLLIFLLAFLQGIKKTEYLVEVNYLFASFYLIVGLVFACLF